MTDENVIDILSGKARAAPVGVTWVPEEAVDALFWGRASTPAEALGALAENVPLDFVFLPPDADWAGDAAEAVRSAGALPVWTASGPLGRVEAKMGAVETLRISADRPAQLASVIDRELHAALDQIRLGARLGVRVVVIADDLAGEEGPLVSPDYVLEALIPCYRRLAEEARENGLVPVFHSDGDIRTILPALARIGYAGVHAGGLAAPKVAPFAEAAWASGMAFIGGLSGRRLLSRTHDEALEAVALSRRGRMLVSDDGGIASAEELAAFVTAARVARSSLAQSAS